MRGRIIFLLLFLPPDGGRDLGTIQFSTSHLLRFALQFLSITACKDIDPNLPRLIDPLAAWMVGDSAFPLP